MEKKWKCQSLQSRLALCDPMDGSLRGSSVHGFPRQEHQSGLPFPSPEDLSDQGIQPGFPCITGRFFTFRATKGDVIFFFPVDLMWGEKR